MSGEHLCPAPPCSLAPPGLHCATATATRAHPRLLLLFLLLLLLHQRAVLVNDRVHVEEGSRRRVSEFAQEAALCVVSVRVFRHATSTHRQFRLRPLPVAALGGVEEQLHGSGSFSFSPQIPDKI
ncbi:hypothetical protein INR49_001439 [Caranx melampygus]|nr:hypothetical protein INR49_001439 [Caranx melampygus]